MDDSPELYENREEKYPRVIHAELNAILHANETLKDYTLYCNVLPCSDCIKLIIQSGISRVVFFEPTEDQIERWRSSFERSLSYMEECDIEFTDYR